jgi:hypothetical protein
MAIAPFQSDDACAFALATQVEFYDVQILKYDARSRTSSTQDLSESRW